MSVEVGWSKDPNAKTNWAGGPVSGIIAPDRRTGMRLVAATPAGPAGERPAGRSVRSPQAPLLRVLVRLGVIALVIYGLAVETAKEQPAR